MRINSHAHGMHADRDPETGKLRPPLRPIWTPGTMTPQEYVRESVAHGVERVLLLDPPAVAFALRDLFGDYVIPAPMVDPDAITPEDIDRLFSRGAAGIKFIAPGRPYGDDAYLPLYDAIRAHRGLAVFHTGYLVTGMFEPGGLMARGTIVDITDMRPAGLDRVARAFPDLRILMAHFGNPWWEEAWKMISSHKNIYADLSGGTAYRRAMDMWCQIFAPNGKLDTASFGKVCFGTDGQSFIPGDHGPRALFDFYDELYDRLQVPDELREQVDRGNMLTLVDAGAPK